VKQHPGVVVAVVVVVVVVVVVIVVVDLLLGFILNRTPTNERVSCVRLHCAWLRMHGCRVFARVRGFFCLQ
jgi:hypothetical protein